MKRIEFIAPVRTMRGNLGVTQRDIVYPMHDNRAYDGPDGEKNTARNYQPIIVGAERRNGKQYFCVRTKTSNHLTQLAKKSMAVMGAACAIYAAMRKDATIAVKMTEAFAFVQPSLYPGTTEKSFFMQAISLALRNKESVITIYAGEKGFTVKNPWINDAEHQAMYIVTVGQSFYKFFDQLSIGGYYYYVDNQPGIAFEDITFEDLIESPNWNPIGLSYDPIDEMYIKYGNLYPYYEVDGTRYTCKRLDIPIDGYNYKLSAEIYDE